MEHLTIKWDLTVNAAYLALTEIGPGEVVESVRVVDRAGSLIGVVDLDARGRVLGIEFLDASERLPHPPQQPAQG